MFHPYVRHWVTFISFSGFDLKKRCNHKLILHFHCLQIIFNSRALKQTILYANKLRWDNTIISVFVFYFMKFYSNNLCTGRIFHSSEECFGWFHICVFRSLFKATLEYSVQEVRSNQSALFLCSIRAYEPWIDCFHSRTVLPQYSMATFFNANTQKRWRHLINSTSCNKMLLFN